MKRVDYKDIGMFEGFNFRRDCAIEKLLTAEEVSDWDHDGDGEAEFWPDGSNAFVRYLLPGSSCTASEVQEVIRIIAEVDGSPNELAKAAYLVESGASLEAIDQQAIDNDSLYVFGPGWRGDLEKEAAYELFEQFWPDAYKLWEQNTVPGLNFEPEDFLFAFSTLELKIDGGCYLVVCLE